MEQPCHSFLPQRSDEKWVEVGKPGIVIFCAPHMVALPSKGGGSVCLASFGEDKLS